MFRRAGMSGLLVMLLLAIGLVSFAPLTALAIGEVTPTPAPSTPVPDATVDVRQLLNDTWNDLDAGNYLAAVSSSEIIINAEPDNAEAYFMRAIAYRQLNRLSLALDDLTRAIELVPEIYHNERAVMFPPSEWFLLTIRGDIYRQTGETGEAMLDYDAAIDLIPYSDNIPAFRSRSELNYQLGDTVAGDIDDSIARGLEIMSTGDLAGAVDFFSSAAESGAESPSVAVAYYNRGVIYNMLNDNNAAVDDWTSAISINSKMSIAYLARGIAYREAGDIQAAGEDFYNRIMTLSTEFVDKTASIGDTLDIEVDYHRATRIQFEGTAGQVVSLRARETGGRNTDPLIALVDPNGTPLAGDDDFGGNLNSLINNFELPLTGTYTLLVGHAEGGYQYGFEGVVRVSIEN